MRSNSVEVIKKAVFEPVSVFLLYSKYYEENGLIGYFRSINLWSMLMLRNFKG